MIANVAGAIQNAAKRHKDLQQRLFELTYKGFS